MQLTYQEIVDKWTDDQPLAQKIVTLFEKVRDIPYGDIGSREPLDVYKQNKGTCSGKHELLKELYKTLDIPIKDYLIMHRFKQLPVIFPEDIKEILERTDIIDPHNYFKIKINDKWIIVDVTWDKPLQILGFPVNENWDGKSDMNIAVVLGGEIYETDDPITKKKELIKNLPEKTQEERKLFLKKTTDWLDSLRKKGEV